MSRANQIATKVREVDLRVIPIANLNITATVAGSAQTLVTVPANEMLRVDRMTVTNKSGSSATLSLHSVADGDSAGDTNLEIDVLTVPANTTLRVDGYLGGLYAADTTLEVHSGTNGALVIRAAATALR